MSERVSYGSSEPSTSRLPEEDSSDMDSDSDNEVLQIGFDSQISTSIRSEFYVCKKRDCVSIIGSMQRHSHRPQLRERDLLLHYI